MFCSLYNSELDEPISLNDSSEDFRQTASTSGVRDQVASASTDDLSKNKQSGSTGSRFNRMDTNDVITAAAPADDIADEAISKSKLETQLSTMSALCYIRSGWYCNNMVIH